MPPRHPIAAAESVFRELGGFPAGTERVPPSSELLAAVERFAGVEFEVVDEPEPDGFLFQYVTLSSVTKKFVIGFARQFLLLEPDDDVACYVQLLCEYHLPPDPELEAAGRREDWWFRDGPEPFESWWGRVAADPIWQLVDDRPGKEFVIYEEEF